jgi:plasmid stabilization system protein ParE
MSYEIDISDVAEMEIDDTFIYLVGRSPDYVEKWRSELERQIETLREFPRRCPLVRDARHIHPEVRQLLVGKYRVLFVILDADGDGEEDTVRIIHVRHTAQQPLDYDDDV